jgi:hypothetical protein
MEAAVETVLATGRSRFIFECGSAVYCLMKWIFEL